MAKDLSEQLSRLGRKAELLVTRFATLKSENQTLRAEIEELKAQNKALQSQNEKQGLELEYLKITGAIAPTSEEARKARAILSNLVREIDACVADLMKDI